MIPEVHNINGCLVALFPMTSVKAVMVQVIVKHGSIQEKTASWGAVHLMEHMSMDATKAFPLQTDLEIFKEDNGIRTGAWTGPFSMGYWFKFPSTNFKNGLLLLDQILFNPVLSEADMMREIRIIEQEYVDAWSNPKRRFSKAIKTQLYGADHPYLRDGLGQTDYIKTLKPAFIKKLHTNIVFPSNMVVSIVGNFDTKECIKELNKVLSDNTNHKTEPFSYPPIESNSDKVFHIEKGNRVEMVYQWLGKGRQDLSIKDRITIGVARYMLGGSNRSFLQKKLRGDQGLVYSCGAGTSFLPTVSVFEIGASTSPERLSQVIESADQVVDYLLNTKIDYDQFSRSKNFMDMQTLMLYDSIDNISNDLVNSLFWEKRIYTPEEMVNIAKEITPSDIKKVYNSYFSGQKFVSLMAEKVISTL